MANTHKKKIKPEPKKITPLPRNNVVVAQPTPPDSEVVKAVETKLQLPYYHRDVIETKGYNHPHVIW
jgi:hypothetical protein